MEEKDDDKQNEIREKADVRKIYNGRMRMREKRRGKKRGGDREDGNNQSVFL